MNPIVSVVMAVYNSQEFLKESVGTILAQTLTAFELILVDDGSKDDSLKLLYEFQEKDSRVRVLSQENQGAGVARNSGMAIAKGKYIFFLDSDDYFEADMLKIMVAKAEETYAHVTICRATCFDHQTGKKLPSDWLRKDKFLDRVDGRTTFAPEEMKDCLFQFTYGWAWDKLFRLDFVREKGFVFTNSKSTNDLLFVFQSLVSANKISLVSPKLAHYRMKRENSISGSAQEMEQAERSLHELRLLENYLIKEGCFSVFEQTFLNFSLEFSLWQVSHCVLKDQRKNRFSGLKQAWRKEDVYQGHSLKYFHNKKTYLTYLLVKNSCFIVYDFVFAIHQKKKEGLRRDTMV